MFRTPADMDWTTMVPPGTSQIHAAQTPTMHMASPMVVSICLLDLSVGHIGHIILDNKILNKGAWA